MNTELENVIMKLIMNGGDARSASMRAINAAEKNEFDEAEKLLANAKESLNKAHEVQTQLIREEVRNNNIKVTLLMVHAQDHVMNAMTVRDLAESIINSRKEIQLLKENGGN